MYNPQHTRSVFRFRRFARAKWAAYSSMHREVTIGRLAVRVANCSLTKVATAAALCLVLAPATAGAQSDKEGETRSLAEVLITQPADSLIGTPEPAAVLTAEEIQQHNIHSLAELVALLPGLDVRTRGVGDAQSDLSMRGGTFDQMVLLLNGIDLTDPQTGHYTLDLPIDLNMVQRVELLSPAQLMARGMVAFCGGVNLVVDEEYADRIRASLCYGSHGTANASLLATRHAGAWSLTAAAAYHRSEGYMPNTDYRHGSLFLQAARHSERDDLHLQLGGQAKGYGSQAFYSTTYPDQYESTRTLTASASHLHRFEGWRLESALYGRLHRDRFELFREGYVDAPAWYSGPNHHLSSLVGLRSRVVVPLGVGEILAGVSLRREGIRSNVLGLPDNSLHSPYTHSATRTSGALFAGWHYAHSRWNLQAVALGLANSHFGTDYGLGADASYQATGLLSLHANLSRSYRLPTFTDLYYQGPNQQSNANLEPEHSTHFEIGARLLTPIVKLHTSAYYRAGRDIIDWCRKADSEMWFSMNHTAVDAIGTDISIGLHLKEMDLRFDYSFCHVIQDAGEWVSGSAMDYLRHQAATHLMWNITDRLQIKTGCTLRDRCGGWVDAEGTVHEYGSVLLADVEAEYRMGRVTLFAGGYNMLDRQYRDHGGVPMPGRTWKAGLLLEL